MSKSLAIALVLISALAYQALATNPPVPETEAGDDRYYVSRLFDATNVVLNKSAEPTAFIFTASAGDSIKVDCDGCMQWLHGDASKSNMTIVMKSAEREASVGKKDLGKWIALPSQGGKAALIFGRDGFGDRQIALPSLIVFRKSAVGATPSISVATKMLEINNLSLPKAVAATKSVPTVFFLSMRQDDKYQVQLVGSLGTANSAVSSYVFKTGEEFAKQPVSMGAATALPSSGKGVSLFGFSFSDLPDSKGTNSYHIDIERIPGGTAGEPSTQDR